MAPGVVVVDDVADLRYLIGRAFKRDGRLEVLAAVGDGQQGIEAVREHGPAAVLMDISMPVMDGITATRQLKQEFPDLRIMILTGYGDERMEQEARDAGADAFVDKTASLPAVVDALAALVLGD